MSGSIGLVTRDPFLALAVDAILRRDGREVAHRAASLADLLGSPGAHSLALVLVDDRADAGRAPSLVLPEMPLVEILIRVGSCELSARSRVVDAGLGGRLDLGALGRLLPAAVAQSLAGAAVRRPVTRGSLLVVGASTGGPEALVALLSSLGPPSFPTLVAIHMPADGTAAFAAHLAMRVGLSVVETGPGLVPEVGTVALLRGGRDYGLRRRADRRLSLLAIEPRGPFRPSIDVLLASAIAAGLAGSAAILSGMGRDGAAGVAQAGDAGWNVFVQDPETCAVGGMPAAALAGCPSAVSLPAAAIGRRLAASTALEGRA